MVVANAPGAAARHQPQWLKLDNAAKIYPATYTKKRNHQYCWSAVLSEDVDRAVLQGALAAVMPRFPSIAVALHRGLFWYYFETTTDVPPIEDDTPCPLAHRSFREIRRCGFRVRVGGARLSLDFFHAVTDGTGSGIFFKTLLAEYLRRKHGLTIPCERGVLEVEVDAATFAARPVNHPDLGHNGHGTGRELFGLFRTHASTPENGASPLFG